MRVDGALQIDGPGTSMTLNAREGSIALQVVGNPQLPTRRHMARLARFAKDNELQILVTDEKGRRLADIGLIRGSSLLGRLTTGTGAIRLSSRGATLGLRAAIGRRRFTARSFPTTD